MKDWLECDTYMIYNEAEKRTIHWTTYGDSDTTYFLSQEYTYDSDFLEQGDNDSHVLINEEITADNTLESLIERTKNMA